MKKLRMALDDLRVDSFATADDPTLYGGTVLGAQERERTTTTVIVQPRTPACGRITEDSCNWTCNPNINCGSFESCQRTCLMGASCVDTMCGFNCVEPPETRLGLIC